MSNRHSPVLWRAAALLLTAALGALPALAAPGQAVPGQDIQVPEGAPKRPSLPPDFGNSGPHQPDPSVIHYDSAKAHRDAQQLVALAQKISAQVDQLSKNSLPRDLIPNLKQAEKLAKRLRSEVPE